MMGNNKITHYDGQIKFKTYDYFIGGYGGKLGQLSAQRPSAQATECPGNRVPRRPYAQW